MDVGALIKEARYEARLSQVELAERAGVSRHSISHYEAGRRLPTIGGLRAILAAAGKQLHAELEPLDADVRAAIAKLAAMPLEDRASMWDWYWFRTSIGPHYRVEGVAAAELLGAPVPVDHLDVALADEPASFATMVQQDDRIGPSLSVRRNRGGFSWPTASSRDGERGVAEAAAGLRDVLAEQCPDGVFWMDAATHRARVRLVPAAEVERYVEVMTPHGPVRVTPLHEIESQDPQVRRVLRVLSSS